MDIKQLQAMGGFVTRTLFPKTIPVRQPVLKPESEWANPEDPEFTGEFVDTTMDVHIRKRSSADFLEMVQAADRDRAHVAILRCVLQADGAEVFASLEQVKQLREWLFIPLMQAVNEVNEFGLKLSAEDEFWHEIAIVLGCTSAEAQDRVSEEERASWLAYRARRGPLNPMLRADRNTAMLAGLICAAGHLKGKSGKVLTADDFDFYNRDTSAPKELTVADFMKVLGRKG